MRCCPGPRPRSSAAGAERSRGSLEEQTAGPGLLSAGCFPGAEAFLQLSLEATALRFCSRESDFLRIECGTRTPPSRVLRQVEVRMCACEVAGLRPAPGEGQETF